jgi:hypothetical protein
MWSVLQNLRDGSDDVFLRLLSGKFRYFIEKQE